jgi:alkylation response protein AidB-like acyl-CoA dehydrogenase
MASGEWVGGLSLFELEGGAASPNLTARAIKQGRRWLLRGEKAHVVNAPVAHHFLVMAVTDPSASPARLSAFLVDRDSPGLHIRTPTEPMGMRTCPSAELVLEDCEVPEEALLGTEGAALSEVLPLLLALDRTLMAAPWLGLMRALTFRTARQAREQELFSRPLARFQSIRAMLADMQTRCELSADMLYRAAWQLDQLPRPPRQDAAGAKLFVSTSAQKVARDAVQVHGLCGMAPHRFLERAYRDSMFLTITGGSSEVLRSIIAGSLLNLG